MIEQLDMTGYFFVKWMNKIGYHYPFHVSQIKIFSSKITCLVQR